MAHFNCIPWDRVNLTVDLLTLKSCLVLRFMYSAPMPKFKWIWLTVPELGRLQFSIYPQLKVPSFTLNFKIHLSDLQKAGSGLYIDVTKYVTHRMFNTNCAVQNNCKSFRMECSILWLGNTDAKIKWCKDVGNLRCCLHGKWNIGWGGMDFVGGRILVISIGMRRCCWHVAWNKSSASDRVRHVVRRVYFLRGKAVLFCATR